MLAVLAASGDRGVSRERLAACSGPIRTKNTRVIPRDRCSTRCDTNSAATWFSRADRTSTSIRPRYRRTSAEFRTAIAAGDREQAIALARGPFLDGFYLPGASGFERWMEEERSRLTSAVMSALHSLATDATAASDRDAAVEWWRQLTALDPLSGRFAVGYLKALGARGDRAEALVVRQAARAGHSPRARRRIRIPTFAGWRPSCARSRRRRSPCLTRRRCPRGGVAESRQRPRRWSSAAPRVVPPLGQRDDGRSPRGLTLSCSAPPRPLPGRTAG